MAIFTFVANRAWETYSHHAVGPKYVNAAMRFENGQLLLFVRNNSDDPLDLVSAKIDIDAPELIDIKNLGAYPDVSKLYDVSTSSGSATVQSSSNGLSVQLRIAQAIAPKAADQFGIKLIGLAGPVDLSAAKVHAVMRDIKGNTYVVAQ